jgi:hypothetical protein
MLQKKIKKSTKKPYSYLDVNLINGVFSLDIPAIIKIVLIIIVSESRFGKYKYSSCLAKKVGCGLSTAHKSISSLIESGFLFRAQRGVYFPIVKSAKKSWVNIEQFNMALAVYLHYIDKLVLLTTVKFIKERSTTCFPKIATLSKYCSLPRAS